MALLLPEEYGEDGNCKRSEIRGPRRFWACASTQACEAERFWGYKCTLPLLTATADHVFPFTFGGKTDPRNLLWPEKRSIR
jgi:hypothetical protein